MNCPHCGVPLENGTKFCPACGAAIQNEQRVSSPQVVVNTANTIPLQYRPLGPWAYFGYALLFSIPLVGFICLIVFSFSDDNINRRNYARSYWCALLVSVIIIIVFFILAFAFGINLADSVSRLY